MVSQNKTKTTERTKKRFRNRSLWLILVMIIVLSFVGSLQFYFVRERASEMEHLYQSMQTVVNRIKSENELLSLYEDFDNKDSHYYLQTAAHLIEQTGFSEEMIVWLNADTVDGYYVFIDRYGKIHCPENVDIPDFTDEQIMLLRKGENVEINDHIVMAQECADGLLITGWIQDIPDSLINRQLYDDRDTGLIIQDKESGMISKKIDVGGILGKNPPEYVPDDSFLPKGATKMEAGYIYPEGVNGIERLLKKGCYLSCEMKDGRRFILYTSVWKLISRSFVDSLICYLLMLVFSIVTYRSAMILRKSVRDAQAETFKKVSGKAYLHIPTFSRMISLLLFSVLITMSVTAFLQMIRDYSVYCSDATNDLERITSTIRSDADTADTLQKTFESKMKDRGYDLADCINQMPSFLEESSLHTLADIWETNEISVFDSKGKIVVSTDAYSGYSLSSMPEDSEYRCWELLKGEAKAIIYPMSDGSDLYQVAVRRIDQTGFIRFSVSAQQLNKLLSSITIGNSILTSDFSGSIIYIEEKNPETAYRYDATATKAKTVRNTVAFESLKDGFIGVRKINGELCCIVIKQTDSGALISTITVSEIASDWLPMLLQILVCYLIISLLLLIGTGTYTEEEYKQLVSIAKRGTQIAAQQDDKRARNENGLLMRKLLGRILMVACAAIPMLFIFNHLFSDNSILQFLLSDRWEKTPNVFSVTMVLILIILAVFICAAIKWFTTQISKNLDSNTGTAVRLFSSILRVVTIVWIFITALYQVGVDMSTIIAGLGITTLALSLAAKDTVNDLIAGIFIVLDGNIHVGDMLEVNGFYGEVIDMNIRTTKLKCYNKTISINNSAMQNVVNCSKDVASVWISFTVDFDTDLRKLKELIESNGAYFLTAAEGLINVGPVFCDLEDTDINGLKCAIYSPVDEANRKTATRKVRTALVNLLQNSDIQLARRYYLDRKDLDD